MRTIKSKNLLIKQGSVYGVKSQSKTTAVGVLPSAETNLRNTQNNRRKVLVNAKLNNFNPSTRLAIQEFEEWQQKVFKNNYKKGGGFFNPMRLIDLHHAVQEKHGVGYIYTMTLKRMKIEIAK